MNQTAVFLIDLKKCIYKTAHGAALGRLWHSWTRNTQRQHSNTKIQHIFLPASTSVHRNWLSKAVNRSEGATTFVTSLLRFSRLHVCSWHILILTWEVERRKNLSNSHPIPKARKQLWAVSFAFHQSSFLGSWWFRNLSCAAFNSGKMFYIFHTMPFISMTYLRSPLLQSLPKGCSACCSGLLNSFYHLMPGDKFLPLLSHLSSHRSHLFNTQIFSVPHLPCQFHRPDSYYSSTWAQVHFRHSLWDYLRSAKPNVLNACTAAAFWSPSHEQGALCARCCTRMIHTYKSVQHGKQFY